MLLSEQSDIIRHILYPAIEDPESLDAILKLIPENDRLEAINHTNINGESTYTGLSSNPNHSK